MRITFALTGNHSQECIDFFSLQAKFDWLCKDQSVSRVEFIATLKACANIGRCAKGEAQQSMSGPDIKRSQVSGIGQEWSL